MNTPRSLLFFAALAVMFGLPPRAPAEEADQSEDAAAKDADDSPAETTTGSATTDAAAAAIIEEIPAAVKKAVRGYKQPKPKAATPNPGGGGGGGGRAVPRETPDDDDTDEGQNTYQPTGKPGKDTHNCDMPPLHHINVGFLGGNGNRLRADATPIVCSTDKGTKHERYCQDTMRDPNRRCCPVKPEGHPLRVVCELLLLGKDPTDGISGPHWQYIGSDPNGGIERHPENPFLAFAYGKGTARACSNIVKVCGDGAYSVK